MRLRCLRFADDVGSKLLAAELTFRFPFLGQTQRLDRVHV